MPVIWFMLISVVAGWLAGQLTSSVGFGWAGNLAVGALGAVLSGVLPASLGPSAGPILGAMVTATVGAVIVHILFRIFQRVG